MPQTDYNFANQNGPAFRSKLNTTMQAIAGNNSGDSEPTATFANMWWPDTAAGLMKQRSADNLSWLTRFSLSEGIRISDVAGLSSRLTGRNRIIGHFDINQRGFTSVGDDAYCCDRWYVLTESGNVTVGQVVDPEPGAPFGWKLTQPDATAKRMGLATIIESKYIRGYRNAAMNFYMRVKPSFSGNVRYAIIEHIGTADVVTSDVVNNWASANFTAGNFFIAGLNIIKTGVVAPGANAFGAISDYGVLGASLNNAILFVWTESAQAQNSTLELNRPQFEPGTVYTQHESQQNGLALCQQYYEIGRLIGGQYLYMVTANALDKCSATHSYKVTKRAAGTITVLSNIGGGTLALEASSAECFTFSRTGLMAFNGMDFTWKSEVEL